MQRHEIHALLSLFGYDAQQEIDIELRHVALLFGARQSFVDRHGAERRRRGLQQPLPDNGQFRPHAQIHDEIGACVQRYPQLAQFPALARLGRRTTDVGVHLGAEQASHAHRVGASMEGVKRYNRVPARHRRAHFICRHLFLARHLLHGRRDLSRQCFL